MSKSDVKIEAYALQNYFYAYDNFFKISLIQGFLNNEYFCYLQVMSDRVPSPESDSSYASSSASGSHSSSSPTCEISLLERLVRTHPIWFLPFLQRSGALHLLQVII
jgi:hypothetical protein